MNLKNTLTVLLIAGMFLTVNVAAVSAAPHFTLSPATANVTVGSNFSVVMGVDSDTSKVVGIDIKASFDSSKLEVVSIEKGVIPADDTYYQFTYTSNPSLIHNDTGMFEATLTPLNSSVLTGPVVKQDLLKVTFKAKAVGTATFSYVCQASSLTETNIINDAGTDVVSCSANQTGSYTITAGSGPTATPTSGTTDNTTVTTPTRVQTTSSLPSTGGIADTIALIIVGFSSVAAALYFRYL